jgi:hypothetical protein
VVGPPAELGRRRGQTAAGEVVEEDPAGGLFTGAEQLKTQRQQEIYGGFAGMPFDPNYHEDGDTFFNLSYTALDQMTDAAAHATWTLAESRSGVTGARAAKVKRGKKGSWKYRGPFRLRWQQRTVQPGRAANRPPSFVFVKGWRLGPALGADPHGPRPHALDREHVITPGILGEAGANGVRALRVDDEQRVVAVAFAHRSAEDDEALFGEGIHEPRMSVPARLLAPALGVVPGGTLGHLDKEVVQSG